ncbi:hypothetical protein [Actinoplanes utahensis]|uniref:hypothetical protein n=1 Tax=Actinoplanes utahensis TaxID=1869 RepID=UPI00068A72CF|nr:hypothetical protein [Actinoplanes utahensis]GIF31683.1 hypothetical protein Aut01nite_46690 [Actinoplanes utahensis]
MRRAILALAALSGIALTAGCAGDPQHVAGEARPAGGATAAPSTAPAFTPAVSPATSSSPSAGSSPSPSKTSEKPKSTTLVFGPTGVGKLKIGMSVKDAVATGEMGSVGAAEPSVEGCGSSVINAAKSADVKAIHSSDRGLVYIPAWGRVATPEGIRIGSTYEKVKKAYPDLVFRVHEENFVFNGDADASSGRDAGGDEVHYRFSFDDYKLVEMALEHDHQNCYE